MEGAKSCLYAACKIDDSFYHDEPGCLVYISNIYEEERQRQKTGCLVAGSQHRASEVWETWIPILAVVDVYTGAVGLLSSSEREQHSAFAHVANLVVVSDDGEHCYREKYNITIPPGYLHLFATKLLLDLQLCYSFSPFFMSFYKLAHNVFLYLLVRILRRVYT